MAVEAELHIPRKLYSFSPAIWTIFETTLLKADANLQNIGFSKVGCLSVSPMAQLHVVKKVFGKPSKNDCSCSLGRSGCSPGNRGNRVFSLLHWMPNYSRSRIISKGFESISLAQFSVPNYKDGKECSRAFRIFRFKTQKLNSASPLPKGEPASQGLVENYPQVLWTQSPIPPLVVI